MSANHAVKLRPPAPRKPTNSDGTAVYLYYYSETDFAIMYVSPELGARIYQTNGL